MRSVSELFPGSTIRELFSSQSPGWWPLNPSIAQSPSGEYKCIVRTSNFTEKDGEYTAHDPDGYVRTCNYLCDLKNDLTIENIEWVDDSVVDDPVWPWVQNMEDARLFWNNGTWWTVGTSRQHRLDGIPKMAMDRLDGSLVVERTILDDRGDNLCEKNWVPILGRDEFMYSYFPFTTVLPSYGVWAEIGPLPGLTIPETTLRGSTQVIPIKDGGYLSVSHEVTWEPHRHYWHRFIRHSVAGDVVGYSPKFYFMEPGIEFAAGLVEWRDNFVVSFGHRDQRAMLCTVPRSSVLSILV